MWRRENSWPYRDSNSDPSVVEPVANHYTKYASPAPPKHYGHILFQITVFRNVTLCSLAESFQSFRGTWSPHVQWWYLTTKLYDITAQKTVMSIFSAISTTNLTFWTLVLILNHRPMYHWRRVSHMQETHISNVHVNVLNSIILFIIFILKSKVK
jgi:hypothetical protein